MIMNDLTQSFFKGLLSNKLFFGCKRKDSIERRT